MAEEVGETGINLSGGQKQRLSIARAFFSGRRILFLDDPLSAVDGRTEEILTDEFFKRARGLILVSHRLGELHRCDRVIVLSNGTIAEDGTPKTLLADEKSEFMRFLNAVAQGGQS